MADVGAETDVLFIGQLGGAHRRLRSPDRRIGLRQAQSGVPPGKTRTGMALASTWATGRLQIATPVLRPIRHRNTISPARAGHSHNLPSRWFVVITVRVNEFIELYIPRKRSRMAPNR